MREAILHLRDEVLAEIGLDEIVRATRAAGLLEVTELVCTGPGGILLVRVEEEGLETALESDNAVEWWERLAVEPASITYLCKVRAPGLPADFPANGIGLSHDIEEVDQAGIDLRVIGSQESITESVAVADEAGMDLLLKRLSGYRGEGTPLEALTDRQREILETAYAMGYFAVPRETTTQAIGDTMGVDASTVTEHLQRAERNLLSTILGDPS